MTRKEAMAVLRGSENKLSPKELYSYRSKLACDSSDRLPYELQIKLQANYLSIEPQIVFRAFGVKPPA